jgi:hypothetical protein
MGRYAAQRGSRPMTFKFSQYCVSLASARKNNDLLIRRLILSLQTLSIVAFLISPTYGQSIATNNCNCQNTSTGAVTCTYTAGGAVTNANSGQVCTPAPTNALGFSSSQPSISWLNSGVTLPPGAVVITDYSGISTDICYVTTAHKTECTSSLVSVETRVSDPDNSQDCPPDQSGQSFGTLNAEWDSLCTSATGQQLIAGGGQFFVAGQVTLPAECHVHFWDDIPQHGKSTCFNEPPDSTYTINYEIAPARSTPERKAQLTELSDNLTKIGLAAIPVGFIPGAVIPAAVVGGMAGIGSLLASDAAKHDPPDLNYTVVVSPTPPNIDLSGLGPAGQQLGLTMEQAIGFTQAILTTTDRATGAELAGDTASQQLQMNALPGFEDQLQATNAQLPAQFAAWGQELLSNGIDPRTITLAQVQAAQQSIKSNGLPSNMVSTLNALGADQTSQQRIATLLANGDPVRALGALQNLFAVGPLAPPVLSATSNVPQVAAVLPASRSAVVGSPVTAFATMINTGSTTANACGITLASPIPAQFSYQTTSPTTNLPVGQANNPVDIPPGRSQSFVVALTPTTTLPPLYAEFSFFCANANQATATDGLNTLLLSASATPVPDVVALVASSDPGIVDIPGASGAGAFAVATVNVGASATITATANTGSATLPVAVNLCQTDPTSGACVSAVGSSVATTIAAGGTPTFGIFVSGTGTVPFDPANSRVFVQFADSSGVVRGETSVAVRTQ